MGWIISRHGGWIFSVNISWFLKWFIGSWNLIPYLARSVTLYSYVKGYYTGYGGIYHEVMRLLNLYLVPIQLTISQQLYWSEKETSQILLRGLDKRKPLHCKWSFKHEQGIVIMWNQISRENKYVYIAALLAYLVLYMVLYAAVY